jgi:hypothetical protein
MNEKKRTVEGEFLELKGVKPYINKRNGQMSIYISKRKFNLKRGACPPKKINLRIWLPKKS